LAAALIGGHDASNRIIAAKPASVTGILGMFKYA
jgi:hypothetical protein